VTEPTPAIHRARDRGRLAASVALLVCGALLLAILFMLISINRNGLAIHLDGDISLSDMGDDITIQLSMDGPIVLTLPQDVQLVATGPDGHPIPANLSFATCPNCGQSMLPVRWNPWSWQIEWMCPACGQASPSLDSR